MLVTFVGCSGVGKNTIINDLLKNHEDKFDLLPTYTTRNMRKDERQGYPYYFISEAEFMAELEAGLIYEHERVHEWYYGGSRRILDEKKHCQKTLLKDIDVYGAETLKRVLSSEMRVFSIFLYVKDMEMLISRLRARGDTEEDITLRRKRFKVEMDMAHKSEYMINNESREHTVRVTEALIDAEAAGARYRLAGDCPCPSQAQVDELRRAIQSGGAPGRVELGFDGQELVITGGADIYAAAIRERAFVQKHIGCALTLNARAWNGESGEWRARLGD